ncbi:dipeptidase [Sphingosinicella microcystinivorans]|uniref:dipeptidase n=1 Tax=Sphingosinicella microcystinivorans TaxID=335406 RepID=UPI0022F3BB85|nr:dipeptidase [Sphingosinicella microcystinivorans]WBX85987.1 dipeptidase [Sphingosinicella microcystinivorans]
MKRVLASVLLAAAFPAHAETLHQRTLTLDTHLDTPMHFARPGWSFGDRHSYDTDLVQVDLGRMDAGDLDGGFFVIYTEQGPVTPEGFAKAKAFALGRADLIRATLAKFPDRIRLISTAADAKRMDAEGKRFGWLSIENSYPLGEDLSLLEDFYRLGVRMAGPVHSKNNQFADSATDTPKWNGLSPLGRQWVAEANRLGIVIDASHSSDAAFDQMLALSKTPLVLSHSGSKTIWDNPRNLDDARIRKLAEAGGVICVTTVFLATMNFTPERNALFAQLERIGTMTPEEQAELTRETRALDAVQPIQNTDFEAFMKSLLHVIEVAGVDHVGIGADWDGGGGVKGLEDIGGLPKVTERLRAEGFSDADIEKIWSGNVLRLLRLAEEHAAR